MAQGWAFATLCAVAAAVDCGLPASVDPLHLCEIDGNGYATLDVDAYGDDAAISIEMYKKVATIDHMGTEHPGTFGDLFWNAIDHRHVLGCPQIIGYKTMRMSVKRPPGISSFGAEWITLYPKDSWLNLQTEFEPYTFNSFGAKIPIAELRGVTELEAETAVDESNGDTHALSEYAHFYIEVSNSGDYEIRYGNPALAYGDKWVAIEFKKTLLRIGTPWADCGDEYEEDPNQQDLGMIIPAWYENPALNSAMYERTISDLYSTTTPTTVVLKIFTAVKPGAPGNIWTDSLRGDSHKDATEWQTDFYTSCYRAGNPCPEDHTVCSPDYCHMDRFRKIIADFKAQSPGKINVLGSVDVGDTTDWDTAMAGIAEYRERLVDDARLDGFYFENVPSDEQGLLDLMEVIAGHIDEAHRSQCIVDRTCTHINHEDVSVFGLNAPLFNQFAVSHAGAPDVWITLYASWTQLGIWTPYSWYPGMIPAKWGAMVFGAPAYELGPISELLYDRGYGNIFIHSDNDVNVPTDHLFFADLALRSVGEEERRLDSSVKTNGNGEHKESIRNAMWACDDTRFECSPICIQTAGKVTVKVQKSLCTEPVDPCLCNDVCYYDVHWAKPGKEIQCFATQKGKVEAVADLVCEYRGALKPTPEQWNTPEAQRGTRGTFPENMEMCAEEEDAEMKFVESLSTAAYLAALFLLLA
jgi:hypothetical protein